MRDAYGIPHSVLVLGGTSELGLATLRVLVARGTRRVTLAGRSRESLEAAAREVRSEEVAVDVTEFDALDPSSHEAFVEEVYRRHGDIDAVLLAFALYGGRGAGEDGEQARRVIETNFVGAVSVAVPIAERLRRQGHGALVVFSSTAAALPRPSEYVYASSKAGMDAFFRGLSDSLDGTGARVLIVRPGFVRTKMTAARRAPPWATTPHRVATATVDALAAGKESAWVPGWGRWATAILRSMPRPLFRAAARALARRELA